MNKKSFFLGVLTGVVLTFAFIFIIGLANSNSDASDEIQYLENPIAYENKQETSFKVFQVLGNSALAHEEGSKIGENIIFNGNVVLIIGENYYTDQVVKIKNPRRVGTYSYTSKMDVPLTVPVLDGEIQ
ncbi:MAG: VPDSG-CTERM exosortase interaction domain protein [Prevotella sp.]